MDYTDSTHDPDAAVRKAGARVGGLSTWGRTPSPEERADALRRLAVARIDREIREQRAKSPSPDPAEVGYLVGLLLMWGQSDPEAVERLERAIREAAYCTPAVTAEDRARLAEAIRDGGER